MSCTPCLNGTASRNRKAAGNATSSRPASISPVNGREKEVLPRIPGGAVVVEPMCDERAPSPETAANGWDAGQ